MKQWIDGIGRLEEKLRTLEMKTERSKLSARKGLNPLRTEHM